MKIPASLLSLLLIGVSVNALAEKVYRWVDENGQTHFSALPPEGVSDAEQYKFKVNKPSVSAAKSNDGKAEDNKAPAAEKAVETKASVSAEEAAAACKQARDYKTTLATNFNRRFKQEDGSFRPLTDNERSAENKKADELITSYCR
ncbi:DUF4124 domain-containing protein [Thalassolituus sp. LLYu03]|uniref:DUF4124 domain-containing protein n=1 Tax=Thalassolituus sp. LLYu03 TaxID=3421656 RepID=UPI003D2DBF78